MRFFHSAPFIKRRCTRIAIKKEFVYEVDSNGCFVVQNWHLNNRGYINTLKGLAHRRTYEECFGEIPEGMLVCHKCDNRQCINPEHLFLGTSKDNTQDMMRKGRNKYVSQCKLTEDQVRLIREDSRPHAEIAKDYGISYDYVSNVKRRVYWKWLV